VIFAFNLALPISELSGTVTRSTLGIALGFDADVGVARGREQFELMG